MREAAERGALAGAAGLVVRVDLDLVADVVEFVAVVTGAVGGLAGVHADVPAAVFVLAATGFPAVAAAGALRAAVAVERGDALVVAARGVVVGVAGVVAGPVFLAGQQRAPGRAAGAAVVEGAARGQGAGVELGLEQGVAARGAVDVDHGVLVDAVVERRVLHVGPLAAVLLDLEHGDAVDGHFLVDFAGRARQRGGAAGGVQEVGGAGFVGGRLVVHGDQGAVVAVGVGGAGGGQAEVVHAVVVVAEAVFVVGVGTVVLVGGRGRGERIAKGVDHREAVAFRHDDGVGGALGHALEAEQLAAGAVATAAVAAGQRGQRDAAEQGHGAGAGADAQEVAAAQTGGQDRIEGGVGGIVVADVIRVEAATGRQGAIVHGVWSLSVGKKGRPPRRGARRPGDGRKPSLRRCDRAVTAT